MPRPNAPSGFHPLASLFRFDPTQHGFYQTTVADFRDEVLRAYRTRNEAEAQLAGVVAGASLAAGALNLNFAAANLRSLHFNGELHTYAFSTSDTDLDVLTAGAKVHQPIYLDGTDATALSLGAGEKVPVALIACNSDGAGSEITAASTVKILAVVGEVGTAVPTPLSSAKIQAALEASTGVHDGSAVRWVWLASVDFRVTPSVTVTNNVSNFRGL